METMLEFAVGKCGTFLATRGSARVARADLESRIASRGRVDTVLIEFAGVEAMTISFADEFLGRFYASLAAGDVPADGVLLLGLNEETCEAVSVCLERRDLVAVGVSDGQQTLLGAAEFLTETYRQALTLATFSAAELSDLLKISPQNMNNRLKRLVAAGAVQRRRVAPERGGKEFVYSVTSHIAGPALSAQ
jgi:hypothetical protein